MIATRRIGPPASAPPVPGARRDGSRGRSRAGNRPRARLALRSPERRIEHLVVIFQENHSFDAFFGTYPVAANPPGQPRVPGTARHAVGQRPHADPAPVQSELVESVPDRPLAGVHLRPGPRVHRRAAGAERWPDEPVPALRRPGADQPSPVLSPGRRRRLGHADGILRRQHRHRALELRAALRAERQLLRHHVGSVDARCAEPDRRRHLRRRCAVRRRPSTETSRRVGRRSPRPRRPHRRNGNARHVRRRHRSLLGRLLAGLDGRARPAATSATCSPQRA